MAIQKTVQELNPLFLVALAMLGVLYLMQSQSGPIPENTKQIYGLFAFILVIMAFFTRKKGLMTIREAQAIAIDDAKGARNRGELKEFGKLVLIEDGVIRRVNKEPDSINVAIGVDGPEPCVIVYAVNPYDGYILRISKRDHWDSTEDPDLKIVIPPTWLEFLQKRQQMTTDVDLV